MQHTEKVTREFNVKLYTCDQCGKRMPKGGYNCIGCGCDVCNTCSVTWDTDPFDGQSMGDYPPRCCRVCHDKAYTLASLSRALLDEAEERAGGIYQQWKDSCKTNNLRRSTVA